MRVEVVPYDPQWPLAFAAVRSELQHALGHLPIIGIEHVGSTSVPGLAAKPIIDVDIIVSADQIEPATTALAANGYRPRGDLGVPGRHAFFAPQTGPSRHVYLVVDGCLSLRNHLGVRRVLRADSELRRRYGELKRRLATRDYDDISGYIQDKSPILQEILDIAGIPRHERDAIGDVNRAGPPPDAPTPDLSPN